MRSVVEQLEEGGFADLTVPDVARAAGLSVRTVYRHFATREEMIAEAAEWIAAHYWTDPGLPDKLDELAAHFVEQAKTFDRHPNLVRALAMSRAGNQVRSVRRTRRLENQNRALRAVIGNLPDAEQRQAAAVFGYLSNMLAWLTMRDENGFTGDESGAAIAWVMDVLIEDLRRRNEAAGAGLVLRGGS